MALNGVGSSVAFAIAPSALGRPGVAAQAFIEGAKCAWRLMGLYIYV